MTAAPEQLNDAEKGKEKPKSPEGERNARESGEYLRAQSEQMTEETMESIDDAWDMAEAVGDPAAEQKLEGFRAEAKEAKQELQSVIDDVDAGWGDAPEPAPAAATAEATREVSDEDIDALFADDTEAAAEKPAEEAQEPEEDSPEFFEKLNETARIADEALFEIGDVFGKLDELVEMTEGNEKLRDEAVRVMKDKLGNRAAEILSSPELRQELAGIKAALEGRWDDGEGPAIMKEATLDQIVMAKELFGNDPTKFAAILDMRKRLGASGIDVSGIEHRFPDADILTINPSVDEKTGELVGIATVEFSYDDPSGENMRIVRNFERSVQKGPDGQPAVRKSVEHQLIELPSRLKANGLAAEITKDSLAEYDAQGVDEVKLHADIDMGGYAWAAYGYGWDKKAMGKKFLEDPANASAEISIGGTAKKIGDLSPADRARALESSSEAVGVEAVRNLLKKSAERVKAALADAGVTDAAAVAEIEALANSAELVTPQSIAAAGKGGVELYRNDQLGEWFTADKLAERVKNGDIDESTAASMKKRPFHAGKIALYNSDWYGKIDLKPEGEQGGENRKMLEGYLAKSTKKKE